MKKYLESLLLVVYIAVLALAAGLILASSQQETAANIVINILMFAIVGIVFINCYRGSLRPTAEITDDLEAAARRIREDARDSHEYLMTPYQAGHIELFLSPRLKELYRDFLFAFDMGTRSGDDYIKSDIADYINDELIDASLHRPQLNQVAGAMTGLGILGTFIGLSMGLVSFNTGTTAEITESIEPLMDGIRVAFHTSIYGMIFSLVFNYVYKRRSYEAESAVRDFVSAFHKYVLPDTSVDGINALIAASRAEKEAIESLSERIAEEIDRVTAPEFEALNKTISDFAAVAGREQTEALDAVVAAFIERMNESLSDSFATIARIVDSQYAVLDKSAGIMGDILDETRAEAGHLSELNLLSAELTGHISGYARDVERIGQEIGRAIDNAHLINDDTLALLNDNKEQLKVERELLMGMQGTLTGITKQLVDSHNKSAAASGRLTDAVGELKTAADKLAKRTSRNL